MRTWFTAAFGVLFAGSLLANAAPYHSRDEALRAKLNVVQIPSTLDGTDQPARLYVPSLSCGSRPLVVLLHSWSADYLQDDPALAVLAECVRRGWVFVQPNFRGPNRNPQACASPQAIQDVLDAVEYVCGKTNVDRARIYAVGSSGGGHMSLVMAARAPNLWAGVSAWVPITDLAAWHDESSRRGSRYAANMKAVCGGVPGASPEVDREYRERSSLWFLENAKGLPIDIGVGIHDGHTGSVPVHHSLWAFNALAEANGTPEKRLTDEQIATFTERQTVPKELRGERRNEPFRDHTMLFQRTAGPARVTVFEGGHTIDVPAAMRWLSRQRRE
ncbi:MAG: prolyl oligopeptidase family serine peptidase [Candidatus Hydrogenedentes bacterium]|nr:prolyl oligopeptidase family serine peptidase [Candidatus Hydrogenedentota bacterium]